MARFTLGLQEGRKGLVNAVGIHAGDDGLTGAREVVEFIVDGILPPPPPAVPPQASRVVYSWEILGRVRWKKSSRSRAMLARFDFRRIVCEEHFRKASRSLFASGNLGELFSLPRATRLEEFFGERPETIVTNDCRGLGKWNVFAAREVEGERCKGDAARCLRVNRQGGSRGVGVFLTHATGIPLPERSVMARVCR